MYTYCWNLMETVAMQAMELYRLLGIQRVIVYKTSCSATMDTVLDYYSRKVR
jgi:hypothetical protein